MSFKADMARYSDFLQIRLPSMAACLFFLLNVQQILSLPCCLHDRGMHCTEGAL